jgi:hypothetical protein
MRAAIDSTHPVARTLREPVQTTGATEPARGASTPLASHHTDHLAVLTDGRQDQGLAALINSLYHNRFDGTLWIGWRDRGGELVRRIPPNVSARFKIRAVKLDTRRPLANFKPEFLELLFELAGPDAERVYYADCDIVVGCPWPFVRAWASWGIAVVEDLPQRTVGVSHPLRRAWKNFMEAAHIQSVREVADYFNSGFIGVPAECRSILPVWRALAEAIERTPALVGPDSPHYVRGVPIQGEAPAVSPETLALMKPFVIPDQDALNMALMATSVPIAAMGPDAMGFTEARRPILGHALGAEKPWDVDYLRRLLRRGVGPTFAEDLWWLYTTGPMPFDRRAVGRARRWSYVWAKALRRYA